MDKLVLIDGNSLLNRAFYALSVFTTKEGLPTNGIFGFVKLLLRILGEEKPDYIAVAFDVHAPTFRHRLYTEYKGTRKPMPEELAVQVPVLKDLLRTMGICTVELAGYEADDLIGTLSRAFDGVESVIYTGDRDSFQLVTDGVSVCFTKRGVTDVDRLTKENFYEKVGLTPPQIIEEKSLMGDVSDNIPGVKGIGEKTALALLREYHDLETVYAHLEEIRPSWREKLREGEASARLSHTLATIDTHVPLSVSLQDCAYSLPFSEEARDAFARLEFRSLVDSEYFPSHRAVKTGTVVCTSLEAFFRAFDGCDLFSFCTAADAWHVWCGGTEYLFPLRADLLSPGFFPQDLTPLLRHIFTSEKRAVVSDVKQLCHTLDGLGISLSSPAEDVTLLRYLCDSSLRPAEAVELAKDYALPAENCAYALILALREAEERIKGTPEESLYRDLELPLVYVLLDMERTGVRVDVDRFPALSAEYSAELNALSERIFSEAGVEPFNLNSTFQLSKLLFETLGYAPKGAKRNQKGGYSTNAEVLEKLAEEHEIARLILQYREIQKLQSTYVDGMLPLVEEGVIHTTYNQTMTATGRLSSANPNLQNIPVRKRSGRELRKLFLAREGNVLIDADYSQIELRLLAHFSGCKQLIDAYNEGRDIHALTASQVFGVHISEVTPEMRRRAKAVNFGIIYGISSYGLAKDLGCSNAEAEAYIKRYFSTYSDVKEYMDENVRRAKADGYVTTILGRKRYFPELRSSNYNVRSFAERAAMNMPLQGSSADIIKLAMRNVFEHLKREGLRTKMILQVHDELVLDSPLAEAEHAAAILKEEMEGAVALRVPLVAEISRGENWYEAKN